MNTIAAIRFDTGKSSSPFPLQTGCPRARVTNKGPDRVMCLGACSRRDTQRGLADTFCRSGQPHVTLYYKVHQGIEFKCDDGPGGAPGHPERPARKGRADHDEQTMSSMRKRIGAAVRV